MRTKWASLRPGLALSRRHQRESPATRWSVGRHHIGADKTATMTHMSSLIDVSPGEREQIRLDFYRAHRAQAGFSSVAVRRDPGRRDAWFLDVGATGPVDVPAGYRGLTVRVRQARGAINAVARLDQVV
jgi:hypothetical protein